MIETTNFMQSGTFQVGCNYWASHAGMMMWNNWDETVVAEDLKQLASEGLQTLRVFPLWSDFQPLKQSYGYLGGKTELLMGEEHLPHDPAGRAGVSPVMMERFRTMADIAEKEGLQLIVGLLTGWMSGRLFVPPALEGLNLINDPMALKWECRFVKYFVETLKDHPAIAAWNLGNECNCMGNATNSNESWTWTALISGAIRQADPERPVISGMNTLQISPEDKWPIQDQGEHNDILTIHPYPVFTPYCNQDPVHCLRNSFHAPAAIRLCSDLGNRPCIAEEMGTLGPIVASEKNAAAYMNSALYTLWSQDSRAMFWWCAYDQDHLNFLPYDKIAQERELGLIRNDREVKPVLKTIAAFRKTVESLPIEKLPPCRREAVCILTEGQEHWAVAYSSLLMAKQAGFDLTFQYADTPLKRADLYLMPCIQGARSTLSKLREALMERVKDGASLYVSFGAAHFQPFSTFFGLESQHQEQSMNDVPISFDGIEGAPVLNGSNKFRIVAESVGAEVLAREENGNIAFSVNNIGKGKVYYLSFPVEEMLSRTPGAFHGPTAKPYYYIYKHIAASVLQKRAIRVEHPTVTLTEHTLDDNSLVAVIIQHAPEGVKVELDLSNGWKVDTAWAGAAPSGTSLSLEGNSASILKLVRG